jgi:hypothetical protein
MARLEGWTDYPVRKGGDLPHRPAPIRRVIILCYNRNACCAVRVEGVAAVQEIKAHYLYRTPGRYGKAATFSRAELEALPTEC